MQKVTILRAKLCDSSAAGRAHEYKFVVAFENDQ